MTRENKLALVVGFALILLVGILISDHFSSARMLNAAELTQAVDPLVEARHDNPDLIALRTDRTAPAPPAAVPSAGGSVSPTSSRVVIDEPRTSESGVRAIDPTGPGPVRQRGRRPGAGMRVPSSSVVVPDIRQHRVEAGEALSTICQAHYKDGTLYRKLAEYNGIDDPDSIRAGHVLKLPPVEALTGPATAVRDPLVADPPPPPPPAPKARTYTVREGDNLSKIAKQLLGSMNRWNVIYEANRDTLDTPNDLEPGMKLRIPAAG